METNGLCALMKNKPKEDVFYPQPPSVRIRLVSNLSSNRGRQHLFMFITKFVFYVVLFELMVKKFTVIFFATIK